MPTDPWQLIGRETELDEIDLALRSGQVVLVTGPAGIGKTHLVATATSRLAERGVPVCHILGASASLQIPLAPFDALLSGDAAGARVQSVVDALYGGGPAPDPTPARRTTRLPVLVIDDAHALDDASAGLLLQLAGDGRVRIAATIRSGEVLPEAIRTLGRLSPHWIEVGPLDDASVTEVASQRLGAPMEGATRLRLLAAAHGNPLLLHQVLDAALADGALERRGDLWWWSSTRLTTPVLDDLVLARIEPLAKDERDVLELVAVAGILEPPLVEQLVDLEVAERLERAGVLRVIERDCGVALAPVHPLFADVALAKLPKLGRRRIARMLATASGPGELRGLLWALEGGLDVDPLLALAAAQAAADMFDPVAAGRLALAASEGGAGVEASLLAAQCLAELGEHDQAESLVIDALERATDDASRCRLVLRLGEELFWGRHDAVEAHRVLDDALAQFPPGDLRDAIDVEHAIFDVIDGYVTKGLQRAEPLLESSDGRVRANAALAAGVALVGMDRGEEATDLAMSTFGRLMAEPVPGVDPGVHLVAAILGHATAGTLSQGHELATLAYDAVVHQPGIVHRAWLGLCLGILELWRGDLVVATRHANEAEVLWLDNGNPGLARLCGAIAALAWAWQGDRARTAEIVARIETYRPDPFRFCEPIAQRGRAWLAHLEGDDGAATQILEEAARGARDRGQYLMVATIVHDLARLGQVDRALELLPWCAPEGGALTRAQRDAVVALAADDAPALEKASAMFGEAGAKLWAAECAAMAAAAYQREGSARAALRCASLVDVYRDAVPYARTPPLETRSTADDLSPREREVARMAGAGMSNRDIAERLVLSERTVENHLQRSFRKLGISSRAALAEMLG